MEREPDVTLLGSGGSGVQIQVVSLIPESSEFQATKSWHELLKGEMIDLREEGTWRHHETSLDLGLC